MKIITRSQRQKSAARPNNILCLSIDRLNPDMLGAYGAAWLETPAFDALASESILFDSFYANSLDLDALCRAFWRGESPARLRVDEEPGDVPSIFRIMKNRGYRTFLLSDVESVALNPCVDSDDCDGRFLLDGVHVDAPVDSPEETGFFKNFEELTRFLVKLDDSHKIDASAPWFVWAHFSGWNETWDFPVAAREQFREVVQNDAGEIDEEQSDPASYAGVRPPYWRRPSLAKNSTRNRRNEPGAAAATSDTPVPSDDSASLEAREHARLGALDEVDRRQSVVQAYAAGVSAFDETLGGFLELLKENGILKNALFALAGARGLALGAPSGLGIPDEEDESSSFYSEETRVPLAIRLPNGIGATVRLPGLCEPRDLFATLAEWPDFAATLADPEFWRLEKLEISPIAGKWSADGEENDDETETKDAAPSHVDAYRDLDPDKPGQNLLPLLVDETGAVRDCVEIVAKDAGSAERALVVDGWYFKRTPVDASEIVYETDPTERVELFVLPDDRYCVSDVADRCDEVVERLQPLLDARR